MRKGHIGPPACRRRSRPRIEAEDERIGRRQMDEDAARMPESKMRSRDQRNAANSDAMPQGLNAAWRMHSTEGQSPKAL